MAPPLMATLRGDARNATTSATRLVRAEYESGTLRGNLGLPIPENRYTAARQADEAAGAPELTAARS